MGIQFILGSADLLWIGVSERNGKYFAGIDLQFPDSISQTLVALAKDMVSCNNPPRVYIENKNGVAYVVVMFRHEPSSFGIFDSVSNVKIRELIETFRGAAGSEFVATGEADFQTDDLQEFMDIYREQGGFHLYIVEKIQPKNTELWGMQIREIIPGIPTEP